jgi:LPS O-antigen subunit length determinant protein (WzzB/FepE family)
MNDRFLTIILTIALAFMAAGLAVARLVSKKKKPVLEAMRELSDI